MGGPAALQLITPAAGNVAKCPAFNMISGTHFVADVTLGIGAVVDYYLAHGREAPVEFPSLPPEPTQ